MCIRDRPNGVSFFNPYRIQYVSNRQQLPTCLLYTSTDALRPQSPHSGNLYSSEYFTLLKNHLKPGGYAVNWIPTGRTIQTFRSVFPYTLNIGFWMFIGSDQPIQVDRALALARVKNPVTYDYYTRAGIDPEKLLLSELDKIVDQPQERWTQPGLDINYDLFPKDEFEKPE